MKNFKALCLAVLAVGSLAAAGSANASLTSFQTYVGDYGVSTAGWGSTTQSGTIEASVPVGSTIVAAYLYTSTYSNPTLSGVGGTLAGNTVNYTALGVNSPSCCQLTAGRTDVTSIIKPLIDGGPGGVYNFHITETSASQDGEGLIVVYSNPSLTTHTIGILDGFAAVTGDTTTINFAHALNPSAPGFTATMVVADGFSYDGNGCNGSGQTSTISVNGTTITQNAGCNDSSVDATAANGNLITVGGFINGINAANLPSVANDHEYYNIVPEINAGDTSISVNTFNTSHDDNIFGLVFDVSGEAAINHPVPEPGTLALVAIALLGFGSLRRQSKRG